MMYNYQQAIILNIWVQNSLILVDYSIPVFGLVLLIKNCTLYKEQVLNVLDCQHLHHFMYIVLPFVLPFSIMDAMLSV